jgi:hypothetical protein
MGLELGSGLGVDLVAALQDRKAFIALHSLPGVLQW